MSIIENTISKISKTYQSDKLTKKNGNEIIYGCHGSDILIVGSGSETYILSPDSGKNTIYEPHIPTNEEDTIKVASYIYPEHFKVKRYLHTNDLKITITDTTTNWPIKNHLSNTPDNYSSSENIVFADGTVWDRNTTFSKILVGTSGKDFIYGSDADDTIDGLQGDDYLKGGKGSDTYIITRESDNDRISETWDTSVHQDIVRFADNIRPDDIEIIRTSRDDLLLRIPSASNTVTISGFFRYDMSSNSSVELVEFANGTKWTRAEIFKMQLSGTDRNERIWGYDTDDILEGKGGNDYLFGGKGSDTYLLDQHSGQDRIYESNSGGDQDRILFTSDVRQDDVTITRQGKDLSIQVIGGDTRSFVKGFFSTSSAGSYRNTIESVDFTDGSTWDVTTLKQKALINSFTSGRDYSYAYSSDDTFLATKGDDHMWGYSGSDTYHVNRESGFDTIHEQSDTGSIDTLIFAEEIAQEDILASRIGSDICLAIKDTTSKVRLVNFFDKLEDASIDAFQFSDGSTWNRDFMLAKILADSMTEKKDFVLGYDSDDTLDGKAGNDSLHGGKGSDSYIFDYGYGIDKVYEVADDAESSDRLLMGKDITSEDVTLTNRKSSLFVTLNDKDSIELVKYFSSGDAAQTNSVETIVFANGTTWDREHVFEKVLAQAATDGDDVIYGYNSSDRIVGGPGNDKLYGGYGSDTYVVSHNSGHDYIIESINSNDRNRIVIDADITAEQLDFERVANSKDLLITISEDLDSQVTVSHFFLEQGSTIDTIELTDGTEIDRDWIFADVLTGDEGDGIHWGYDYSDDLITGGAGNDLLMGGLGSDTFVFAAGFGIDIIDEYAFSDVNRILFEGSIAAEDVHLQRDDRDLIIQHQDSQITVEDYFYDSRYPIAEIEFADGTSWQQQDIQQRLVNAAASDLVGSLEEAVLVDALLS